MSYLSVVRFYNASFHWISVFLLEHTRFSRLSKRAAGFDLGMNITLKLFNFYTFKEKKTPAVSDGS